jgi:energy-converting hydrogenase Eha subunit A
VAASDTSSARRERVPFLCGALLLLVVGGAARLPRGEWGVPVWVAAPVLVAGLAASVCLMTGQNVIEGGCVTLIAGTLIAIIVVERVAHSDVRPLDAVQDCVSCGFLFLVVGWVLVAAIVSVGEFRRRRRARDRGGSGRV